MATQELSKFVNTAQTLLDPRPFLFVRAFLITSCEFCAYPIPHLLMCDTQPYHICCILF